MTEKCFVDTNVFVYLYDTAESAKRMIAAEWVDRLWRTHSGRTSVQVINELYVTLLRKLARHLSPDQAWEVAGALLEWNPQPTDRDLLLHAYEVQRRYRTSWWDSLIVAAAQLQDCEILLTEDLQSGMKFGDVVVQNPFGLQVQEPCATYAVAVDFSSRHRARGRPRKQRIAGRPA